MILGTGVDIAEVPRIRKSVERFGDRFLKRIFTEGEIAYCERKASRFESYAARFAAKEAGMKALGTAGVVAFGGVISKLCGQGPASDHPISRGSGGHRRQAGHKEHCAFDHAHVRAGARARDTGKLALSCQFSVLSHQSPVSHSANPLIQNNFRAIATCEEVQGLYGRNVMRPGCRS